MTWDDAGRRAFPGTFGAGGDDRACSAGASAVVAVVEVVAPVARRTDEVVGALRPTGRAAIEVGACDGVVPNGAAGVAVVVVGVGAGAAVEAVVVVAVAFDDGS